ncbi:SIS domain-containing protein [uncultured Desulfovibrio sp.]|uniref:KpsF/GutQ family sugar-phosphate isomerase n=1 Tax=uncultured Desulfovibrio sp. TaxID=167968 RepID=UPI00266F1C5C|nr:KpsF/GutQ family sugar-phosphate isomerase [uncultured Desulfovibrio sp.]
MAQAPVSASSERKKLDEVGFAVSILQQEAHALTLMARGLNAAFCEVVDLLYNIKGRIAVTGMGKSGHVARKVAATLASTGSPAYFIHPGEASHGDLGMLATGDAVLAFSNSGNTTELSDIVLYAARRNIPLTGVTRNADSLLGKHATHILLLPPVPEADPLDCAPTTSTTLQMALGDALALTLMRRRGCSPEEFHRWHPGGSLGRKLLTVREIMHTGEDMPLLAASALMPDVLMLMTGKGFGVAGILEKNRLAGIITDGDLRRHMGPALMDKKAKQVMHPDPVVVNEDTLAVAALRLMQENKITSLFVIREGKPVGILNVHDCLRAGVE